MLDTSDSAVTDGHISRDGWCQSRLVPDAVMEFVLPLLVSLRPTLITRHTTCNTLTTVLNKIYTPLLHSLFPHLENSPLPKMTDKMKTIRSTSFSRLIIQRDYSSEAAWCILSTMLICFHSSEESLLLTERLIRVAVPLSSPPIDFQSASPRAGALDGVLPLPQVNGELELDRI